MGVTATVTLRNKVFEALAEGNNMGGLTFSEYVNKLIAKDLGIETGFSARTIIGTLLEQVVQGTPYIKQIVENDMGEDTIVYKLQPRIPNSIVCTIKIHKKYISVEYAVYSTSKKVKEEMAKCFNIAKYRGEFMQGLQLKQYNRRTAVVWRSKVIGHGNAFYPASLKAVMHDIKGVLNVLLYSFGNYWTLD